MIKVVMNAQSKKEKKKESVIGILKQKYMILQNVLRSLYFQREVINHRPKYRLLCFN